MPQACIGHLVRKLFNHSAKLQKNAELCIVMSMIDKKDKDKREENVNDASLHTSKAMHRMILGLTLPAIVSNITVPLLGLCDTAISGHLGSERYLAAIAAGGMMLNVVFWLFGFLRAGATGLAATAYGNRDPRALGEVLMRSFWLAIAMGAALIALQVPLLTLLEKLIGASEEVAHSARNYFSICIWGAPALLATMALNGWMIGVQTTFWPMVVSVTVNVLNIIFSLTTVFLLQVGFEGVAIGTLCANWCGLLIALPIAVSVARRIGMKPMYAGADERESNSENALTPLGRIPLRIPFAQLVKGDAIGRFFKVNSDLFFRSFCILGVSMTVTAIGARMSDAVMGANAIMMQMFLFFSYFMDGFAYCGEALCGRFAGAGERPMLMRTVRAILMWSVLMMLIFTLLYTLWGTDFASLLTDSTSVLKVVDEMHLWLVLIPLMSVAAFIFDGFYIGLTATFRLFWTTVVATAIFAAICFLHLSQGTLTISMPDNDTMWIGFLAYLATRGILLSMLLSNTVCRRMA